ncbi:hypothetical protein O181_083436 [Austropuccinia psidii MF-1]|uniref:T4 RNA ligase 1-like N-terminal domain-containing protein n=1 Tax=Austropuccinia psidii MF-1 TaxID=1389203 RepID=A0A9Q3FP18_9BASI|nr:hypothetical protein [Austropuccinia psidii MF-1]
MESSTSFFLHFFLFLSYLSFIIIFLVGKFRKKHYTSLSSNSQNKCLQHLHLTSNLLITSKYATIESNPYDLHQPQTHSLLSQRWLNCHLYSVSLTRPQLAQELWDANATAFDELSHDEFEEHAIQTPSNHIGLNLHGIILNIPQFMIFPPSVVAQCAKWWGFHKTPYITLNSLNKVEDHCSQVKLDVWPNLHTPIESIVIIASSNKTTLDSLKDPHPESFWKIKLKEPYLTYQKWREITRKIFGKIQNLIQT